MEKISLLNLVRLKNVYKILSKTFDGVGRGLVEQKRAEFHHAFLTCAELDNAVGGIRRLGATFCLHLYIPFAALVQSGDLDLQRTGFGCQSGCWSGTATGRIRTAHRELDALPFDSCGEPVQGHAVSRDR